MKTREAINQEEVEARRNLVDLAKAMLDGNLSYFEGASRVLSLRSKIGGISDQDEDLDAFVVIQSETDHFPLNDQKHLWSKQAIAKLEPELIKTEDWALTFAPEACRNIITRFNGS